VKPADGSRHSVLAKVFWRIFSKKRPLSLAVLSCAFPSCIARWFGYLNAMPKIEIFTQAFCPYCARALSLLRKKGVEFQEIDAPNGSSAREQARSRSGGRTSVPQIFVDDQPLGGSDELAALDRDGKLDALLGL